MMKVITYIITGLLLMLPLCIHAGTSAYFTTTWKTNNSGSSNSTSITIPIRDSFTYAYQVDWNGDGDFDDSEEGITYTGDATHDYGAEGTYTINIMGLFPAINFGQPNTTDNKKILSIDNWGANKWQSMQTAFIGANKLVLNAQDTPDLSACENLSFMFSFASMVGGDSDTGNWDWDTSNVTQIFSTFGGASLFNKDISSWVTTNVNNMGAVFKDATSFNQDISSWKIENVVITDDIFNNTPLSSSNYDAILVSWDAQAVQPNLTIDANLAKFCTQPAMDARMRLINNDGWTINDAGQEALCVDLIFTNSFENLKVVKANQGRLSLDFSQVIQPDLDENAKLIVIGKDESNQTIFLIHLRNDLGQLQIRMNNLDDGRWTTGQWQDFENKGLMTLVW